MTEDTNVKDLNAAPKKKGLLLGIAIGGAVGAITALLAAPKPGSEVRGNISEKYRYLNDKTKQTASTIGRKTQEATERIGNQTTELVNKAKETKQSVMDTFRIAKEETKEELMDDSRKM